MDIDGIGVNLMDLIFREETNLRRAMGSGWGQMATSNLNLFRYLSLPYRWSDSFSQLLAALHLRPDFTRLWQQPRTVQTDLFTQLRRFEYAHPLFGPVQYAATLAKTITTTRGRLYLIIHNALDTRTARLYIDLGEKTTGGEI